MNTLHRILLSSAASFCVAVALTLAACGGSALAKTGDEGPNGGFILSLPGSTTYLEVLVSEAGTAASERAMTVHVLDADLEPKRLLDPPRFVEGSTKLTGVALAEASSTEGSATWVFVGEQFDGDLPHGDFELRLGGETIEAHLHPPGAGGHGDGHDHDHDHDHGDEDHSGH